MIETRIPAPTGSRAPLSRESVIVAAGLKSRSHERPPITAHPGRAPLRTSGASVLTPEKSIHRRC